MTAPVARLACVRRTLSGAAWVFAVAVGVAAEHSERGLSPEAALARLEAGNERFAKSESHPTQSAADRRAAIAEAQHPFAVVVACADSRVTPEIVFDQGLGDLFVIRVAGNVVEDFGLASIEYAVAHLGARLVVVLGHERCGAIRAAVLEKAAPGHVGKLLAAIVPAIQPGAPGEPDPFEAAMRDNAVAVAKKIRESQPALSGLAHAPVKVVAARYDLDTGLVSFLE